jgi:hypothetical protein
VLKVAGSDFFLNYVFLLRQLESDDKLFSFFRTDSFVSKLKTKIGSASGFTTNFFFLFPMEATNKGLHVTYY